MFEEVEAGQISSFMSLMGVTLSPVDNYFTFPFLLDAKDYSILGNQYLGATAIKTYEGKPWEVMRENSLVYDFNAGEAVPISSITKNIQLSQGDGYFITNGLILPGSITDDGSRVTEYSAWFSFKLANFKYTDVTRE